MKVLDDNVFAIIKSPCIFISPCFNMVSFRGKKKARVTPRLVSFRGLNLQFRRASLPYWESSSVTKLSNWVKMFLVAIALKHNRILNTTKGLGLNICDQIFISPSERRSS